MSAFPDIPPEVIAALAKDNKSNVVIELVVTFTTIAFVCVCLRFFSRVKFVGLVGIEDYIILISMIFSILSSACLIQTARYGNGRHMINIPLPNVVHLLRYLFFGIITYHASITSTKLSILLQYRRIFPLQEWRLPIYIVMGLCLACGITAIFCAAFTCIPVDAYWQIMKRPFAKCINQDAMYFANAGLNIATDLMVAALPVRQIWSLQIPRRQKVALLTILTVGWFVCIISIVRLYFLVIVSKNRSDQTWYSGPAAYTSAMEANLAIVCASTPALKPLVVKFVPDRFRSKQSSNNSGPSTTSSGSKSFKGFLRLNRKPSQLIKSENIILEQRAPALPLAQEHGRNKQCKEVHVTQDVEQQHVSNGRPSDSSQKDLYPGCPPLATYR